MAKIGIVSYNVLTEKYCNPKSYPKNDKNDLDNKQRKKKIIKLIYSWVKEEKIISLQEVSREFSSELYVFFSENSYYFLYNSYGNEYNGYMGVGIAYPSKKYSLKVCKVKRISEVFENESRDKNLCEELMESLKSHFCKKKPNSFEKAKWRKNTIVALNLECCSENKKFWVLNYHMPCAFNDDVLMLIHSACISKFIDNILNTCQNCVLCIDMNSQKDSHQYKYLTSGSNEIINELFRKQDSEWGMLYDPSNLLKSCYKEVHGSEPEYTNYSFNSRGTEEFKGTIDYIFLSKKINPYSIKKIEEPKGLLPNNEEPSDHVPLVCELVIE